MSKHYFLYSMVGLVLAGFLFSRGKASGSKEKSGQLAAPVLSADGLLSVGAVRLWRDYEENEVAADTRYKGKRLRVTGTVLSIERDLEGRPVLHLLSGNPIFLTTATLDRADLPAAAQLKKGDQVVVRCIGAGREMRMPQLERCLLL
ncbi:MAG: OB-fold protein [Gemmatimonadales bacterium]